MPSQFAKSLLLSLALFNRTAKAASGSELRRPPLLQRRRGSLVLLPKSRLPTTSDLVE
jgi:hypothetical protein